jgi:type VI secretion system protein ImpB
MDDFSPASIVQQVEELRLLFEERQHLRDLLAKLDSNDELHQALVDNIVNPTTS